MSGMALLKRRSDKVHVKINESKSAVNRALGHKFVGYELWMAPEGELKRLMSKKALETFLQRIKQLTRRAGGRSVEQVTEGMRYYVQGWKAYLRQGMHVHGYSAMKGTSMFLACRRT